ncbi:MAG: hypothetical protein J6Y03_00680 [Alphaproteobacteria bacterium]|nr:hypothetical protein [Alphaproteobacteria bacterium]
MKKVSPIKNTKRELALLGAVVVTALSPMKSEGSVEKQTNIKDIKKEVVLDRSEMMKEDLQQESKSLVDAIERGEKIVHGSIVIDIPKLKQLQRPGGEFEDFEIVFEGDNIGLKFHDDGKRGLFERNEEAKTYTVLMPREKFEDFLAGVLRKEIKKDIKLEKMQEEDPRKRGPKNNFAGYFIEKNGTRTALTEKKDAMNLYDKVVDVICRMNTYAVIKVGEIIGGFKQEITQFGGKIGKAVIEWVGGTTFGQNKMIKNILKPFFKDDFTNLVLTSAEKNKRAIEEYEAEVKKYLEDHDPEIIAQREKERIENLILIDKIDQVLKVENKDNESNLVFLSGDKRFFISTQNGKITNQAVNYFALGGKLSCWKYEIYPEELQRMIPLLDEKLTNEQKGVLGEDFFKTIQQKAGVQIAGNSPNLNVAVVAALKENTK